MQKLLKKSSYAEAIITEIVFPSPLQIQHNFQPISGAPYIDLPINEQKNEETSLFGSL